MVSVYSRNSRLEQQKLVDAYGDWVLNLMEEGYEIYLVSFMFKPMVGSETTQLKVMEASLQAFYATLVTRVVRRPRSPSNADRLPILMAHPDLPVRKRIKISLADAAINGGLHFQGLIALPPQNRIRVSLEDHLATYQDLYCPAEGRLVRIHASSVTKTPQKAARYTLKMAEKGRFGVDHTLVLPRSRSELEAR